MILGYYEEVRVASRRMLEAARDNDWKTLVEGERQCAAIIEQLQTCGEDVSLLGGAEKKRAHEIILAILADDADIRNLTQPWLRQLENHLGTSRMTRRVATAYRP
jgi:flagellar protein FliT